MRAIYTLLIAVFLLGGTYAYLQFAESVRRPLTKVTFKKAEGVTAVEIKRSFDCFGNPDFDVEALKVEFNNKSILKVTEDLPASKPIRIENIEDIEEGVNELLVYANWESEDAFLSDEPEPTLRAMQVTVFFDGNQIANEQFVVEANESWVGVAVNFKIPNTVSSDDGHDH